MARNPPFHRDLVAISAASAGASDAVVRKARRRALGSEPACIVAAVAQWLRWFGAVLVWVLQPAEVALAHDMERLAQVALHPTDADTMVLRYIQSGDGLLYSDDGAASFDLLCKSAIYPETTLIETIELAGDGHALLAGANGAYEDDGHGCGFHAVEALAGRWVRDFAPHPSDPDVTFAAAADVGGVGYRVLRRDAGGKWSELGAGVAPILNRLHAAQTDAGVRLYASGLVGTVQVDGVDMPEYVLLVSDDEGESWREHPFGPTDGTFRLEAVDPTHPDRLVATVQRNEVRGETLDAGTDHVLISEDQGATFTPYLSVTEISGVTFAPDGRMWIGDLGSTMHPKASQGVWFASDASQRPVQLGDYPVACLAHQAATDTLFACQRWWFGHVNQEDGAFTAQIRLQDVQGLVQCADRDIAAACEVQLCRSYCTLEHFAQAPVCSVYEGPFCGPGAVTGTVTPGTGGMAGVSDGGAGVPATPDASAAADAGTPDAHDAAIESGEPGGHDGGCTCAAAGMGERRAGTAAMLVASALAALGRRARRTRRLRT
jgi:hypothetical protein